MKTNLDTLKDEVEKYLVEQGFNVFYGQSRLLDSLPIIYWDCDSYPDFRKYLAVAKSAEAKLVVFHHHEFTPDNIDDALDRLEAAGMPPEESRTIERRLKELRKYEGFTCALELSFDYQGRIYVFDLCTEWYDELSDILEEIDMFSLDEDEDEDNEGHIGGYFSQN
jgi:hypothetical protein